MGSAAEMAFLAGEEEITIVPRARIEELELICGAFETMQPAIPQTVPFWLGMYLKKRGQCRIQIPPWLEIENLEGILETERRHSNKFAPLPFHYLEMAKQILASASDDMPDAHRIRALVADIEDNRRAKWIRKLPRRLGRIIITETSPIEAVFDQSEMQPIGHHRLAALIIDVQRGLQSLDEYSTTVQLNHISAIELHCIRQISTSALNCMGGLSKGGAKGGANADAPPSQPPPQPDAAPNRRLASALRRRTGLS